MAFDISQLFGQPAVNMLLNPSADAPQNFLINPAAARQLSDQYAVQSPQQPQAAQQPQKPDPWAGLRDATVDPIQTGSVTPQHPDQQQYVDHRSTKDKLFDMFSGWAAGNSAGESLAMGAQGYRGDNKTVQFLMHNGYDQDGAQAIAGNKDSLNLAMQNIMRKQNPAYALQTQQAQLGIEKTQAQIDQLKNGQRGLINAGGGQIYNPNNDQWLTAPNSGKSTVSVDGSNIDLNGLPPVEPDANGTPNPDQQKAFFAKLPPATAAQVQGIIDGRVDLTKSTSMKDGQRQAYAQLASMGDPNFDMSMGPLRVQTRKNYGPGGYMGKMADSTNLAIQHLAAMKQAYDKMGNGNYSTMNALGNWWHGEDGNGPIAGFKTAQNGVASELEKTFTGSNGTEGGRTGWKDAFNENASPDQMKNAIDTATHMLSSRVETYNNGWDHAMRGKNQFPMLTPNSLKALKEMGVDTSSLGGASKPSEQKSGSGDPLGIR